MIDVLEQIKVGDIRIRSQNLDTVPESTPFSQVLRRVANSSETIFPVVDGQNRLTGIFTLRDIRLALLGSEWGPLVLATDIATRPVLTVTTEDDLHTALRRLTELNLDEIPVVHSDEPSRLIGLLSRRDLVATYTAQIRALRAKEAV